MMRETFANVKTLKTFLHQGNTKAAVTPLNPNNLASIYDAAMAYAEIIRRLLF